MPKVQRWRWRLQVIAMIAFVLSALSAFEFDQDSCETMLPIAELHEVHHQQDNGHEQLEKEDDDDSPHEDNDDAHEDDTDDKSYRVKPAVGVDSPFKIVPSTAEYRRNRPVEVTIEGGEFNTFILQARSVLATQPKPLGSFHSAPPSVKFMNCLHAADTATAKDSGGKQNLHLHWKAPDEDKGTIAFYATIVQKDMFWNKIKSESLTFNQFPPSTTGCGITKSCYRYSSSNPNCEPDECDYAVIAQITEDNEIEFTIGGIIKENSGYIGIGFTMDKDKMSYIDVSACVKHNGHAQARQFLVEDWKNGPVHHQQVLDHEDTDIDGDNIWCQYRRPLHIPGPYTADLRQSLFHVYLWGAINETSALPVLPPTSEAVLVMEPWNYSNTLNVMHYVGSKASREIGEAVLLMMVVMLHAVLWTKKEV